MAFVPAEEAEKVVDPKPEVQLEQAVRILGVDRQDEGLGPDEMRIQLALPVALSEALEDQPEL